MDSQGQRFSDSKRLEGNLPELLDGAVSFVNSNMRTALRVEQNTGKRVDIPEYPMDAVREVVLNALVHRDYSRYTENMPIQLTMFSDRMEVHSPGGLYGRLTLDQLGKVQPDTRNPFLSPPWRRWARRKTAIPVSLVSAGPWPKNMRTFILLPAWRR